MMPTYTGAQPIKMNMKRMLFEAAYEARRAVSLQYNILSSFDRLASLMTPI